ncbi:MAG: CPBP family intramembrane metalloprotease [Verrucomicrobia bacterium]|nr:CPBP family intramembrane metalloprotease [Verrucomicrobiota bacterium]
MAQDELTPGQTAGDGPAPPQAIPPVIVAPVAPLILTARAQLALPYPGFGMAILMVVAVVVVQFLLAVPIEIVGAIVLKLAPGTLTQHPLVVGAVNFISIGLVIAAGVLLNRAPLRTIFPMTRVRGALFAPIILTTLGAGILLSEVDNAVRWVLPMPQWLMQAFQSLFLGGTCLWGTVLTMVVVAPVTEELFMRGLVFRGLLNRYGVVTAVLVSSFLFALLHLNPWQFISAAALGVLFAWWFWETRSLVPCLVGHALTNAMVVLLPHLPVKIPGFNTPPPAVEFQPWWFDLSGLALAAIGVWWFKHVVGKRGARTDTAN